MVILVEKAVGPSPGGEAARGYPDLRRGQRASVARGVSALRRERGCRAAHVWLRDVPESLEPLASRGTLCVIGSMGGSSHINTSGGRYDYLAIGAAPGFKADQFTGDESAGHVLSGVGFQPAALWIQCVGVAGGGEGVWRVSFPGPATDHGHIWGGAGGPITGAIEALLPDGFRVGPDPRANSKRGTCHYAAFAN
jgi:hypothetical protein